MINPEDIEWDASLGDFRWVGEETHLGNGHPSFLIGDRLWVREAWRCEARLDKLAPREIATNYPGIKYVATDEPDSFGIEGKYRPSIHMPRWASRLTLIVTDVRVQRLQDISESDAIAEGVERDSDGWRNYLMPHTQCCASARGSFATVWDHINGPYAWAANPWVAAYTFMPIFQNIDQISEAA